MSTHNICICGKKKNINLKTHSYLDLRTDLGQHWLNMLKVIFYGERLTLTVSTCCYVYAVCMA